MSKLLALLALGAVLAVGGCQNKEKSDMDTMSGSQTASKDACPACAGVQTATADGKCPKCGMKAQM